MAHPVEPVSLRAGDLLLRPWRRGDAAAVHRICQDDAIARWTTVPSPYSADAAEAFVLDTVEQWAAGRTASWAVVSAGGAGNTGGTGDAAAAAGTGEIVLGSVSLSDLDRPYPELGFWVAAEARGRGIAATGARAACRWAFDRGAPKVLWLADVGNEPSWRVVHRLGFRFEGRRRAECHHPGAPRTDAWAAALLPGELERPPERLRYDPFVPLRDGEVSVRRWREADAGTYAALQNEPSVTRWNATEPALTAQIARDRLLGGFVEDWMLGRVARLAVCEGDDVVGEMQVRTPSYPPGTGELGWSLRSASRGRGVATRAGRLVRDWAFDVLGLRRLLVGTDVENHASRALAERLGFRPEGRHRQEAPRSGSGSDGGSDEYGDGRSYGMLATDVR